MADCALCGAPSAGSAFCPVCGRPVLPGGARPSSPTQPLATPPAGPRPMLLVLAGLAALVVLVGGVVGGVVVLQGARSGPQAGAADTTPSPGPAPSEGSADEPQDEDEDESQETDQAQEEVSLAEVTSEASAGVLRVTATTCSGTGAGSGFLVAPDLVATAAHVVDGAAAVAVTGGRDGTGMPASGVVVGHDDAVGLALVRLARPQRAPVLELAAEPPADGAPVAVIGFPRGQPVVATQGSVSGRGLDASVAGASRSDLIGTDATVDPGISGGPLVDALGRVVGIVSVPADDEPGARAYAVAADRAASLLARWRTATAPAATAACDDALGPQDEELQETVTGGGGSVEESVAETVEAYFQAINAGRYAEAYARLSPAAQARTSFGEFADGAATSYDYGIALREVEATGGGGARAWVTFTSLQSAEKGYQRMTCSRWSLDYTFVASGDRMLIDSASGHAGGPRATPCD